MKPLRHPLVALVSVGLVLACTCGPLPGDDEEQGTDTASGQDPGSGGDSGDSGSGGPTPCPDYTGYTDGAWYTYVYTESWRDTVGYDGGYRMEVEHADDGSLVVRRTSWAYDPSAEVAWMVWEGWCDDQGWWVSHELQEFDVGQPQLLYYEFDYPDACLSWPATVTLGEPFRTVCARTRYSNDVPNGEDSPVDVTTEVVEAAEVDTPAGRFDALGFSWSGGTVDYWRNQDLGFLADRDVYVLEDWGP